MKSSITDLSATRKINNALSGGSLKAPASINSFFRLILLQVSNALHGIDLFGSYNHQRDDR